MNATLMHPPRGSTAKPKSAAAPAAIAAGLTLQQRNALQLLAENSLFKDRCDYGRRGLGRVSFITMKALVRMGLAEETSIETPWSKRTFNQRGAEITNLGRSVCQFLPERGGA